MNILSKKSLPNLLLVFSLVHFTGVAFAGGGGASYTRTKVAYESPIYAMVEGVKDLSAFTVTNWGPKGMSDPAELVVSVKLDTSRELYDLKVENKVYLEILKKKNKATQGKNIEQNKKEAIREALLLAYAPADNDLYKPNKNPQVREIGH